MPQEYKRIPLPADISREKWLELRRGGIGGSDAAAIAGLSPYNSAYAVWADKKGLLDEKEDTEAMREGRDLEDYVATRFMEASGKKLRRESAMLQSTNHPFMLANVDRLVIGEKAGFEAKTASPYSKMELDGENPQIPPYYYCQCVHYLAVTGMDAWYIGILIFGKGFWWFKVERNEEDIAALIRMEKAFWEENIEKNVPPLPTATDGEAVQAIFPTSEPDSKIDLYGKEAIVQTMLSLKAEIDAKQGEYDALANGLKSSMGTAERGIMTGYYIDWKPRTSRRLDTDAIKKGHPDIYSRYCKETTTRYFTIKEDKENA